MPTSRQSGAAPHLKGGVRPGEEGYVLVAVLFLVALVLIGLAVAAPRMAKSIQRDKEIEAVHRGEQYKRAIQLYYRKFGRYPSSIDQLLDTNNIRFLRKKYTDPITGKDDWRLIHPGQAKVPPMGFFGQPLAGVAGTSYPNAHVSAASGNVTGTSAFGSSTLGSSMGSPTLGGALGSSNSGGIGVETPASDSPGIPSTPAAPGTTSGNGSSDSSTPGNGSTSGLSSMGAEDNVGAGKISKTDPGSHSTLSAGQIIGVGLPSTKASLLDYKKQDHYNKWEFVYFPIEDMANAVMGAGAGAANVNGNSNSNSPFGNGNSNSPFGNSNSNSPFGNSNSNSPFSSETGSKPGASAPPANSSPQQ